MQVLEASGARLSRNAAYELFEDPEYRGVLELRRRLRTLARELRRGRIPSAVRGGDGSRVELRFVDARARFRQSLFLTGAEVSYLVDLDPALDALLRCDEASP